MSNKLFMLSAIIFPLFSALLFVSVPYWSTKALFITLLVLSIDGIFAIIILLGLKYERFFVILQFDIFCFFFMAMTNRVWQGGVLLTLVLIIISILSIYFGNNFSKQLGRLFSFGSMSGISAGVLGLTLGRLTGIEFAVLVIPFICSYILLFMHAAWKNISVI